MNRTEIKYLIVNFIIFIAACMETDIYLPTFTDMMTYFNVSADQIQSLLTWNFIGICLSCPIYGPLSDAFGRKKPVMLALGLFLLGSIMTIYSESFQGMLWGRFLQGLGSGGCFTLGTAIIFDVFRAEKAVHAINIMNMVVPFAIAAAPILGGYLNYHYGFRSNFIAVLILVLVSFLISLFFFDETLPKEKRTSFQIKKIMSDFKKASLCVPFWQLSLVVCLTFAVLMVFLSGTAVLYVKEFGVDKSHLPYYQFALLGAWLTASWTNKIAIAKWGIPKLKRIGTALMLFAIIGLLLVIIFAPKNPELLTGMMIFYCLGFNWLQGLYFPESMEMLPEIKGITASLLTSARLLLTAIAVGIASTFYDGTIYPIVGTMVTIAAIFMPLIISYERTVQKAEINVLD